MTITKYSSKHMILLPVIFTLFSFILSIVSTSILETSVTLNYNLLLFFSVPGHVLLIAYVFLVIGKKSIISNDLEIHILRKDLIPGILFGLLALITASLVSLILPFAQSPAHEFVFSGMNSVLIIYILFASFVAPFVEELVFRGFLWRILEKKNINKYLILIITTVLFAAMHMDINRFPALFAGGLIYGLIRIKTGSTGCSIVAHITNNFIVSFLTFILPLIL